jgi:hypothetical protein
MTSARKQAGARVGKHPVGQRLQHGQSLIEATLVLLLFFVLLLGVVDCGQVVVAHQALVERVRGAVRWGVVRPWDGGSQLVNLILYNQAEEPRADTAGFLGMTPANVQVGHQPATSDRPDDEMLTVAIINYEYHFFSPWLSGKFVNPRPVRISSPMAYRTAYQSAAEGPATAPVAASAQIH